MEYPQVKHLYRYRAYDAHSLSILINKKIWAARPKSFNDPFDCNIRFKSDINSDAIRKYIPQIITGQSIEFNAESLMMISMVRPQ